MHANLRNRDTAAVLSYHEETKHSEERLRRSRHVLDRDNRPLPFKIYRGVASVALVRAPEVIAAAPRPALAAIAAATVDSPRAERPTLDLAVLSRVLWLAAGITKRKRVPGGEIHFRAHSNTGALYHLDLYVATADLPDLPAGVYHFDPAAMALDRLRDGDYRGVLAAAAGSHPRVIDAPVVLASASTYWRNAWKYQARAWRHCFWDGGTLHANLLAVAAAEGLGPCVVAGFADAPIEVLLGLDPVREGAIALVPLGAGTQPPPPAPSLAPLSVETEPLSRSEVDYPAIREAHAASSLASAEEAKAWRGESPRAASSSGGGPVVALERAGHEDLPDAALGRVIRRRGSTRAFDPTRSLPLRSLSVLLDVVTRGVPADFLAPHGSTLLDLYLVVNAVDGIPRGAYVHRREDHALELLAEGDHRAHAGRLALGQALAADAAVNVYSMCALGPVLERFGNRGYRAAQLEGGVIGGWLYLGAYASGFGATGLTFFDDEVTDFFSPHATGKSPMFLTALGYANLAALR